MHRYIPGAACWWPTAPSPQCISAIPPNAQAAGEWHQLKPLFPPLEGMAVLDLGCGYGWHCKYAVGHGAAKVLGIDLSEKILAEASRENRDEKIRYRHCGIEAYEYPESAWDVK